MSNSNVIKAAELHSLLIQAVGTLRTLQIGIGTEGNYEELGCEAVLATVGGVETLLERAIAIHGAVNPSLS